MKVMSPFPGKEKNLVDRNVFSVSNSSRIIGKGGFGTIYEVNHEGKRYALKVCDNSDEDNVEKLEIIELLDHENVVKVLDTWYGDEELEFEKSEDSNEDECIFELDDEKEEEMIVENTRPRKNSFLNLMIVMPFYESTLEQYLLRDNRSNNCSVNMFTQLVEAIRYIHSIGIIHRDLKPPNIFLSLIEHNQYKVVLGDFGLATFASEEAINHVENTDNVAFSWEPSRHTSQIGSVLYCSPEQCHNKEYNEKTDIYSLGLILFELCSNPIITLMEKFKTFEILKDGVIPSQLINGLKAFENLILDCMKPPLVRPTAAQILKEMLPEIKMKCKLC